METNCLLWTETERPSNIAPQAWCDPAFLCERGIQNSAVCFVEMIMTEMAEGLWSLITEQ